MKNITELMCDFVETNTKLLVDNPDDVNIKVSISTKSVIIQIKTAQEDCGKIIGKKGRTVESLKILTLAVKNTHFPEDTRKITVEIIEDEDSNFNYR